MSIQLLEYSPKIDKKLKKAAQEILKIEVNKVERIRQGEVNYVYKIKTRNKNFLARVPRYKNWPNIEKLQFVFKKLSEKNIPHPRIVFLDTSSTYFEFGLIIFEWINGKNGKTLISEGKLSQKKAVREIAKTLSKVHKIKINGFGEFDKNGKGNYKNWEEQVLSFTEDDLYKRAVKEGKYKNSLNKKGLDTIKNILSDFNYKPEPALVHKDPTPENVIFRNEKVTFVDWDNASGSTWIEDLAWITFWEGKKVKGWFIEAYRPKEQLDLINRVEKIIHIRLAVTNVPYFLYLAKNKEGADEMIRRLQKFV